jgi:predicted kinase
MNLGKADIKFLNSDPRRKMSAPAATWVENVVKAKDVGFLNGDAGSNSPGFAKSQVWEPIIESLNETEFLNNGERWTNPARYLISAPTTGEYKSEKAYNNAIEKIFSTIRQNQINLSPDLNQVNESFIEKQTVELVNRERAELQKLSDDNPGFLYGTARFGGAMAASLSDPVTQQAMMLEGAVAIGRTLWRQLFNSAVLNGGAGAFSEIAVKEWYDELDVDYEFSDFVANVSANAALGAAFPLAGAGIKLTANQARKGYLALTGNNQRGTLENREMAAGLLEAEEFEELENPLQSTTPNEAQYVHNQRLVEAGAAAANAQPPAMSPDAPLPMSAASVSAANLEGVNLISMVKASDIGVDAETFQFKAEGDEFGVTARLQGVQTFNPYWAGTVSVYEYADGRKVIADGHQRLGLAKRIMAQDPSQDISLHAYTFREVDGITPEEMRVVAALKNIVEGSGTAIDAAKVLRVDPSRLPDLPPNSELVQQARGIMPLSDNSFGMVVNGVVPAKYAAFVGRLIDDKDLQDAAMSVLAKASPENKFQAEAIVRQVKETPSEQVTQISLFGEELMTESYYFERGKILDRAYKELRRDKAAFETLVRNAERLEAEGNILAADANQRKAATDAQTITLLQALANRKGPLSDALNDAAKTARDTGSYGPATSGFLDAVRRSIDAGDFQSISAGDIGRGVDGTAEVTRPVIEEPILEGFDEPTGPASDQQTGQLITDMFGAEEVEPGSLQDLSRLLDQSPTREQIDNHPSVLQALDEIASKPDTVKIDGYDSDDWHNSRVYKINGEDVVSTDEAMLRFERDAEAFAFKELNLDVEPVLANKELTIVLGPPAAGKSTIANELAIANRSAILDSDEIKKTLPEYEGGVGASAVHEESSNLAKELQALMIERGTNIVLPKVGHSASSIRDVISLYKNKGYKVRLVNMDVTPENAFQRMIRRFVSTGRIIPPEYLDRVGSNPSATYKTLKQEGVADGYAEIDNNGGFNEPKTVREISGDNPLLGSSFDVPSGGRTGPDAIRSAEREGAEDLIQTEALADADMDLEVPVGQRLNPETNELEAVSMPLKDLRAMMDEEDAVMKRLEFCTI